MAPPEGAAIEGGAADGLEFSEGALREDLLFLDRGSRLQSGTPGDVALTERVASRLSEAGFTVERQAVASPGFDSRRCAVEWGGQAVDVIPQAIVSPTGPGGVAGPLKLWRDASDTAAMGGAIAILMLPPARHSRLLAPVIKGPLDAVIGGGAAGVVIITSGRTGETIYLNAPYDAPYTRTPVAVLGPKPGAALIDAAIRGENGRLVLDGEVVSRASANVFGRITGRGPVLVVSTPRTGWVRAVAERGPGLAILLALARWAPRALPGNDLLFVTTCAHEYDNAGGLAFIATHAPKPEATRLWVHLGAGIAAREHHEAGGWTLRPLPSADAQRYLVGTPDTLDVIRSAFAGQPGLEQPYPAAAGAAGELGEVLAHGYPRVFGAYGGNPFHHTDQDDLSATDPALVRRAALAFRDSILRLAPLS